MKKYFSLLFVICLFIACSDDDYKVVTAKFVSPSEVDPQKPEKPDEAEEQQQGDGSASAPYIVSSANDWCTFVLPNADKHGVYYKLSSSFKFSSECVLDVFCGILDGNGNKISVENTPLCRIIDGATIRNLQVDGKINNIAAKYYVNDYFGVVACKAIGQSRIVNCQSAVIINVSDNDGYVAGICGHLSNAVVDSCSNFSTICKIGGRAAGISVLIDTLSRVCNSSSLASIEGTNLSLGGIAFRINGQVQNSYVFANISGKEVGGIAVSCKGGCIDNCYYSGVISCSTGSKSAIVGSASLGGVVRFCYYKCDDDIAAVNQYANAGTVENCYKLLSNTLLEENGFYGTTSLVNELNSRCEFILGARYWKQLSGNVSFD